MKVSTLLAPFSLVGAAHAFFRMPCHSRLTLDAVDPIVNYGVVPSPHIHTIMGGNNFSPSCNSSDLRKSSCTSCKVKGDGSAYWVPALYFQHEGGKLDLVEQVADMLVYYLPERMREVSKVHNFPDGFRMVAGDPRIRSFPGKIESNEECRRQRAIGFNCMNYKAAPKGFLENNDFPSKEKMTECVDGLRAEIAFPNCWDGKNFDSPDHRSHVAYPENVQDGACPPSHPVRIISILFETIWNVAPFSDKPGRFVWSHADPTGYGYHGDFMAGWEDGLLERVMEDPSCSTATMTGGQIENCGVFQREKRLQTNEEMKKCTIPPFSKGDYAKPMESLPGCPSIEDGPAYAKGCHAGGESPNIGVMESAPKYNSAKQPVSPAAAPAAPAPSKCSNGKQAIKKDDPNVVWVTKTVKEYATAAPVHRRHTHRKRHVHHLH